MAIADEQREEGVVDVGAGLVLDWHQRRLYVHGVDVELSNKENEIVLHLAREPYRVYTKAELLTRIWRWDAESVDTTGTRTLDSHACRARSKIARAGGPKCVINVWGVGYKLLDRPLVR